MTEEKTNGHETLKDEQPEDDIVAELAALGRKFGEAISTAWHSEERRKLQADLKEGLERFTAEVDSAIKQMRKSEVAQKVGNEVQKAAADVKSGKVADELRRGTVKALRALSEALDRMASSFTPYEEEPKE